MNDMEKKKGGGEVLQTVRMSVNQQHISNSNYWPAGFHPLPQIVQP